jgi:hypothetical protein
MGRAISWGAAIAPDDYQNVSTAQLSFAPSEVSKTITVLVNGDKQIEANENFSVTLSNPSNATISKANGTGTILNDDGVVISQVYGGGGNAGATLKNDFVELFNRSATTIDISVWSVQYASATSSTGSFAVTNLCSSTVPGTCTLPPGHYYLVKLGGGAGGTTDLPAPDAAGTTDMAAIAGKVALVNNRTALSAVGCPTTTVVDFVGYGTTANCFEGAGRTPAPSNTTSVIRKSNGCQDTDDNTGDFDSGTPTPRHTASATHSCP